MLPTDIHDIAFSSSPIGKRGYHKTEVDAFRQRVEAELARLTEENNNLRDRMAPTPPLVKVQAGAHTKTETRPLALPDSDHNVHLAKVLGLAQEMADQLTSEARAGADARLSEARTTTEQLLCEVGSKAGRMVNEARSQAEAMLNDARIAAEALDRQSRNAAARVHEAARKHNEITGIIAALREETSELEKKIEDLRTFEFDYRIRLKTYLESQMAELDGHRSDAPADILGAQLDLVTAG